MIRLFDKVMLSTTLDPMYTEFLPLVTSAWRKLFGATISLTVIADNPDKVKGFVNYAEALCDEIHILIPPSGVRASTMGKVGRLLTAMEEGYKYVLLNDMDLVPLSRWYLQQQLGHVDEDKIVCMGHEHFHSEDTGMFPLGNVTAKGNTFKEIFNPEGYTDIQDIFKYWDSVELFRPDKVNKTYADTFSDELLFRNMLTRWNKPERMIKMSGLLYPNPFVIDRAFWNLNENYLRSGYYAEAHMLRPYSQYKKQIEPIERYIYES